MENVNPVKELLREKYFTETGPPGGIFQEKKFFEFMPLFQVGYSTANSYKTSKNTNILNARSANPSCNIPRRSLDYGGGGGNGRSASGKETVIFILQNLSFVMSKEKYCMTPRRVMEFLGFVINSETMTIFLP